MAAIMTAWSLFILLFGYRYYRLVAMLQGITIGAVAGAAAGTMFLPQHPMLIYAAALAAVAITAPIFYYISVFIIGFSTSGLIIAGLSGLVLLVPRIEVSLQIIWTVGIIAGLAGLAGGVLAIRYHRGVIILVTSIAGAVLGVAAAMSVAVGAAVPTEKIPQPNWWQLSMALAVAVALAVVGIIIQNKTTRQDIAKPAARRRSAAVAEV